MRSLDAYESGSLSNLDSGPESKLWCGWTIRSISSTISQDKYNHKNVSDIDKF